jgi:uncharacterized integral membrane protein
MSLQGPDRERSEPSLLHRAFGSPDGEGLDTKRIVGVLIAVAVLLLIVQNGESAQLTWLFFDFSAPLWIMLLLTMVAGAASWELVKKGWRRRRAARHTRPAPDEFG